jgi:phosphate transport system substrate-binding protein
MKPFYILLLFIIGSCTSSAPETLTTGSTLFIIESSDSVGIAQPMDIFLHDYKNSHIAFRYAPENMAIDLFLKDSARVLICDRKLSEEEEAVISSRDITLRTYLIAAKSIAIIVNNNCPITEIKQSEIQDLLNGTGKFASYIPLVANGNNSIYNYLSANYDLKNTKQAGNENLVMEKIETNPKAIGFIPVDYLLDEKSGRRAKNIMRVKALPIRNSSDNKLYSAAAPNMKGLKYPLVQEIYLHDAQGKSGLGTGFAGFVLSDRGQLIIKKMGWYAVRSRERDIIIEN